MSDGAKTSSNGKMGLFTLSSIAIGTVVGAGIVTNTGIAITATGRSVWLAYLAAIILGFIVNLPIFFYSSVVKFKGGYYTIVTSLLGEQCGGIYCLCYLPMWLNPASFTLAMGLYVNAVLPAADIRIAGIIMMTAFFALNLFGIDVMAKAQNFMVVLLVMALSMFAIFGIGNLLPDTFEITQKNYFLGGADGFFTAIILLVASTTGYAMVSSFSPNAKNPKRDIPLSMISAFVTIIFLYISVSLVAGNVLPVEVVSGQSLAVVGKQILPGVIYPLFMVGGPLLALTTTTNSCFSTFATPVLGGVRDGWLPKELALTNRHDVPVVAYSLMYIISILPVILNFSLKAITTNIVFVNYTAKMLLVVASYLMPRKFGEHWEKSPYHLPNPIYYFLMTLAVIGQLGIIYFSSQAMSTVQLAVNIVVLIILSLYAVYRYRTGKTNVKINYSFDD